MGTQIHWGQSSSQDHGTPMGVPWFAYDQVHLGRQVLEEAGDEG